MKLALAQFNPTVGDFAGNTTRILALAQRAKERGADLAVFSELCICGYLPQDLLERPAFIERNLKELKQLAAKLALPAIVGFVGKTKTKNGTGSGIANKAALLSGGKVVFEQSKMLLPTYDVFDESRYFQPATEQKTFEFGSEKLGITICEDVWNDKNFWAVRRYDRDPVTELVGQGTTVLINISASPYTIDKRALRVDMLRSIALSHQLPIVYVNQVGGNDSLIFDGASEALTLDGKVAAQAAAFEEDLVLFDTATGQGEIHGQPPEEIAYAYRALVQGTRDYVHKCRFEKTLVGLSGGIDSALVVTLVMTAVWMAPAYHNNYGPEIFRLGNRVSVAAAAHVVAGSVALLVGIYVVLVAGTPLVPKALRFTSYKAWMRTLITIWWLALLLGVLTYWFATT